MNAKNNRILHALAGELVTQDYAHQYLKVMAGELFNRQSTKDLTDAEANKIAEKLRKEINSQRLGLYNARNEGIEIITVKQVIIAKQLQRELGWSDEYMHKLLQQRYVEDRIETMPSWKAIRLINYLIERKRKNKKEERKNAA